MFNADITWTPVVEKRAPAPPKQQSFSSNYDNASVSSTSTSWSSKIRQWSRARNGKSSSQQEPDESSISELQATESGMIPTSLPTSGPRADFKDRKAGAVAHDPSGLDELHELPGMGMRQEIGIPASPRFSCPTTRSSLGLSRSKEVSRAQLPTSPFLNQSQTASPEMMKITVAPSPTIEELESKEFISNSSSGNSPIQATVSQVATNLRRNSRRSTISRKQVNSPSAEPSIIQRNDINYLQRMIRRMERASRRTMLDRIQDVWLEPLDDSLRAEIDEEKALWVLTALYSRSYQATLSSSTMDTSSMQPLSALRRSDRILELGHDPVEVHQLSALQSQAKITFIPSEHGQICVSPLPSNVDVHPFSRMSLLRDSSFEHIRANALASAFEAPQLKQILQECHRLLVPGGQLELRLMDPVPDSNGTGPLLRDCLERHLLLNLEKSFRCLRPMLLIPIWMREVGFTLSENEKSNGSCDKISFPVVTDNAVCSVEDQLACYIGRKLWQSLWAGFLGKFEGGLDYWWDDEAIAKECLQKSTTIDFRTLFATKSD